MKTRVKEAVGSFDFHFGLSMDILRSLTDKQLSLTVGENMGNIGEQFRHMAKVIIQYTEAIENKEVSNVQNPLDLEISRSREQLIGYLEGARERLGAVLDSMNDEVLSNLKIDWSHWEGEPMGIIEHLAALAGHQNLHNGELIVYLRTHEIPFPKSWSAWGL